MSEYTKNRMSRMSSARRIINRTMKNCREREIQREREKERWRVNNLCLSEIANATMPGNI